MLLVIVMSLAILAGLGLGFLLTIPMELRRWRTFQMAVLPCLLVLICFSMGGALVFAIPFFLALGLVIAPNLSWILSGCFVSLIDPQNWKTKNEHIHLHPIRQLIKQDKIR